MRLRTAVLAVLAALLVGMGAPGLRALHLATDTARHGASDGVPHACEDGDRHAHHCHEGDEPSHGADPGCATCELLLALATGAPAPVDVPTLHSMGHPQPGQVPERGSALAAPRVTAARPPPHALT